MRRYETFAIALTVLIAGCGGRHAATSKDLSPLTPCESREISLDGADVLITGNADGSLASVHVRNAVNDAVRRDVLRDVYRTFGTIHIDTETVARSNKWGLTTWTDRCGRPITFTVPSARPSR